MNYRLAKGLLGPASLLAAAMCAAPAMAQEEAPGAITVSGSAALVTDYRFRGVSQTDKEMAVQAGATVTHRSGFYVGTWGSNLSGWGTFGGSNMELDLIGGYSTEVMSGVKLDVGLTWYMYPGGASDTDFAEPYVKLSGDLGPATVLVGVAYAPKQQALGKVYASGADYADGIGRPGAKSDNFYMWADAGAGIPGTPLTVKAHLGYSNGNSGLGPNGTSVAPTGEYLDWLIGADAVFGPVTLGVAYVDTNISKSESAYLLPNFSSTKNGSSIAGSTVLFSATAAF